MAKFHFKLQVVLDLKDRLKHEALRVLGLAEQKLALERQKKLFLQSRLEVTLCEREKQDTFAARDRYLLDTFVSGTKQRIEWQERAIFKAQKEVDQKRREYLKRKNTCLVYEKLKDKAKEAFHKERQFQEQKRQEEWVTLRHPHKKEQLGEESS